MSAHCTRDEYTRVLLTATGYVGEAAAATGVARDLLREISPLGDRWGELRTLARQLEAVLDSMRGSLDWLQTHDERGCDLMPPDDEVPHWQETER